MCIVALMCARMCSDSDTHTHTPHAKHKRKKYKKWESSLENTEDYCLGYNYSFFPSQKAWLALNSWPFYLHLPNVTCTDVHPPQLVYAGDWTQGLSKQGKCSTLNCSSGCIKVLFAHSVLCFVCTRVLGIKYRPSHMLGKCLTTYTPALGRVLNLSLVMST